MKVLSDYYQEYTQNTDSFYYKIRIELEHLNDETKCKSFISNTLQEAKKGQKPISKLYRKISGVRIKHIVSCYIFGAIIYFENENIKNAIDSYFTEKKIGDPKENNEDKFKYIWFLICFYHDIGYAYENGQEIMPDDIFHSLATKKHYRYNCVPQEIYSLKLLECYDSFIRCRFSKQRDHGIAGGLKMYQELSDLMEENKGNEHFPKYLKKYFSLASWIIACHNMFYIGDNDDNFGCYKCKGLNSLIRNTSDSYPITLNEYPLFFLFSIVDSIEPIKTFNDLSILDKIFCDLENMEFNLSGLCSPQKKEYRKKICNLEKWLTKVSKKESEDIYKIEL